MAHTCKNEKLNSNVFIEILSSQNEKKNTRPVLDHISNKTSWVNFAHMCRFYDLKDAQKFVSRHLGTECSIDGFKLIIKGRYQIEEIESLLITYEHIDPIDE